MPVAPQELAAFSEALSGFLIRSHAMTHLNISACELNEYEAVMRVSEGIKKSKTL